MATMINILKTIRITTLIFFILIAFNLIKTGVYASDCSDVSPSGDLVLTTACSFSGTINGVDSGTGTTNTAIITLNPGSKLILLSGQKIAVGSILFKGGSLVLSGGSFSTNTPIWMIDEDSDGYPGTTTQYAQKTPPLNGRRRSSLISMTILDSNDSFYCADDYNPNVVCSECSNGEISYQPEGQDRFLQCPAYNLCNGAGECVLQAINPYKDITSFSFTQGEGVITGTDIAVNVPFGTILTTLVPTIEITGASVNPSSGAAQDFTSPITYTVTASDSSTKEYTVTVTVDADPIAAAFKEISITLSNQGIENNLNTVTSLNYKNFSRLYFEKSINGVKMGKIVFISELDLSSVETQDFLKALGSKMDMSQAGVIGLDFTGTTDSLALKGIEATIKFYGLDALGFTATSTSDEINAKLTALDDSGNIIDKSALVSTPGTYLVTCETGGECHIFTVSVNHFTKYKINNATTNSGGGGGGGGGGSGTPSTPACNDQKPGNAPVLLSAVSNSANSITLTWAGAEDPVSYYLVTFGTRPGQQLYGNPDVGGNGTASYTINSLQGGRTYYFKVRGGNGCMPGDFSNEVSGVVTGGFIAQGKTPSGFAPGILGAGTEITPTAGANGQISNPGLGFFQRIWEFIRGLFGR